MIKRIDHIAIVVEDIDKALHFWRDGLGLELTHVEDVPDQGSAVAFLPTGEGEVELVKPTSETSGIARYLAKRGPGMHHICFEVDDINATLAALKARGARLINEAPTIGTGGKKIAFIHPESTHGVLVELYELTPQEHERRLERQLGLADRVLHEGRVMRAAVMGFLNTLMRGNTPAEVEAAPVPAGDRANSH
ncbi:MAG TPA: methylmalonyl-CoA epimerase [Anaerolineales bacterium]|nr:methylmalonyl-CoA epimerase [Anaerolineales bacterium]